MMDNRETRASLFLLNSGSDVVKWLFSQEITTLHVAAGAVSERKMP
jgi:hypothetical protein